jgi:hypothetical protein
MSFGKQTKPLEYGAVIKPLTVLDKPLIAAI